MHENAGHENAGHEIAVDEIADMTRIDSILFNFSFFSCNVMLTLQQWNCVT